MGSPAETESPELQKLTAELRRMDVELQRMELARARALDEVEREFREEQVEALKLENRAKSRDLDWKRSGVFWTRVGLLVAWIATLVPVWISVNRYWDEREEAAREQRRAAAAERQEAIRDAMRRYTDGTTTAAFELPLYPEGVSFLVSQLQWDAEGPDTEEEIEKAQAALIALESAAAELTENQQELLRHERKQLLERLEALARRWETGQDEVGEQEEFLAQYEIHRRLRRLLGDEDDGWGEATESEGSEATTTRGEALEETRGHILESRQG
jgi:hypothetical protein